MIRIKKVYDRGFTVLDNSSIDNPELSWKAKGLFTYLWRQPDDWNFYIKEVAKHAKGGIHQVSTGLDELEEQGYLYRKRVRNEQGQLKENDWQLSDTPKKEWMKAANKKKVPKCGFPRLDNPGQENPGQENCNLPITNSTKYKHNQVRKELNKSLSKEERERDANVIEILINYLNEFANEWHRAPITFSPEEYKKLVNAVHNKETSSLRNLAEKTVIYSEQYPQGYLLNCIKNLPDVKEETT